LLATIVAASVCLLVVLVPEHRSVTRRAPPPATHVVPQSGARPATPEAVVSIVAGSKVVGVPRSFLGLSTEYWALPTWERRMSVLDRVLALLHVPGNGPLLLRIGGDSADEALWEPRTRKMPEWVIELTTGWLREVRTLVRESGARLILDLNLVTASPSIAAQWARAAERALPDGSIVGFEIGNEPDLYDRQYWLAITSGTSLGGVALRRTLSAVDYARAFRSYARELSQAGPGVPLLGPAVADASSSVDWISALLAGPHPGLRAVSAHLYPYDACAPLGSSRYPTIARLLSEQATAELARAFRGAIRIAHRARLSFRLTELNSVTCGGTPGVSDTFATALWAPDALFGLLRAGVDGVNLHVRPRTFNAAFSLTKQGLAAHPLLYGLILFARTLGADPQLVELQLHEHRSLHLKAWAIRARGDDLHVLLINKGGQSTSVRLRLPAVGRATIQRLVAASVTSHSGATLGGKHLTATGRWQGRSTLEAIEPAAGSYELTVPKFSAALVSMHLRPGALTVTGRRPSMKSGGGPPG